jgi:autotransporter-associated beta strand protein
MDANWSINSLTFNSGAGAFTLSSTGGFVLTIQGGGITNNSASTETINNAITLGAAQTWSATSGALSFGGNITNGGFLLTISGGSNTSVGGIISGTGGLTKSGAGTLTLSGTNTYSGGTTFNAGTVSVSSNSNLGASSGGLTFNGGTLQATGNVTGTRSITMTGAGTFDVSIGRTVEESGAVSGNGALSLTGFGNLILSGSGSNGTGSTNISGVLSIRGTVALGSGNLAFNTGILELGNSNFTRALGTGANQVNMNSAAGFAAYGADRFVNLGGSGATVTWGSGNFIAAGSPLYFGTLTADHTLDFQNGINLNVATRSIQVLRGVGSVPEGKISGVISGTGTSNLTIDAVTGYSAGSLILSNGGNSYAGTTTITAGNLLLQANATGTAGNTVLGSGASDILVGNTTGAYDAGLLTNSSVTISRNIRAQSGNTGVITIGGYSATTSTFSGNIFLGTNSGAGKGITLTAASGGTTTFSGVIQDPTAVSGPGLVRKNGAGTVVLTGANTFAGGTSVDGGTLTLSTGSASSALGATSGVTVNSGGTLMLGADHQINNAATMTLNGGTFALGGKLEGAAGSTGVGALTLTATSTIDFAVGATNSIVQFSGLGTHTAGTLLQIANWNGIPNTGIGTERLLFAGATGSFTSLYGQSDVTFNGVAGYTALQFPGYYEITAVPEPSTWFAASFAFVTAGFHQRRRLRQLLQRR